MVFPQRRPASVVARDAEKNNAPPPDSVRRRPSAGGRVTARPSDRGARRSPAAPV